MILVEVVVLMGAHCISPVQTTGAATDVAKVQCAVVIEKDTDAGTIRIVPAGASREPQVVAVLERLEGVVPEPLAPGTKIEPAYAPPGSAAAAVPEKPIVAPAPRPAPSPAEEASGVAAPAASGKDEAEAPAKAEKPAPSAKSEAKKDKAEKSATAASPASKCLGAAKPKWYTNAEGRRKYRCVLPG